LNNVSANDEGDPFLHLTLDSIVAKTKIKTYDMEFNASLADLIVDHEQFIGKGNQQLRLLSAQLNTDEKDQQDKKLVSVNFLHTSPDNPLFSSPTYNGIENRAHVHFTKLVVTLQLEALLSILRFQDALLKKLPKDTPEMEAKKTMEEEARRQSTLKVPEDSRTPARSISTTGKVAKKNGKVHDHIPSNVEFLNCLTTK
jgi:hypothetical protein